MLILWNTILAVFSIIGFTRCAPQFWHLYRTKGFMATICQSDYYRDIRVLLWYYLFVWSKVPELIDTMFIVLRGSKLINLHWIHHCLTLVYSWYSIGDQPATTQWMITMNYGVHSLMYTYYVCMACGWRLSRRLSACITSLQVVQMMAGFYINYVAMNRKLNGQPCDVSLHVAKTGVTLYALFMVLFMNFFVKSYLLKPLSVKPTRVKRD
ncbi:unnamed protein product [Medioppia subpectinata]|uniref:Elongation of very long chain fatty acids protein n=1 Tax=Medioppia subpectinata TaxID=1979941 RepID=A0A7R9QFE9_9ACAR|nr:unnamed protein product [Medioppia subpectinata]CAG2119723.1 unnamed protein product [Medioppia subpectinata]